MSCFRVRVRTLLALTVVVALVAAFPVRSCVTRIDELIPTTVPLTFLVVDDSRRIPLGSASVRILEPIWSKAAFSMTTDSDGRADILFDTRANEGHSPFFRVYRHIIYSGELRASAEGYQATRFLLGELTADSRYHYGRTPPPIVIRLKRLSAKP